MNQGQEIVGIMWSTFIFVLVFHLQFLVFSFYLVHDQDDWNKGESKVKIFNELVKIWIMLCTGQKSKLVVFLNGYPFYFYKLEFKSELETLIFMNGYLFLLKLLKFQKYFLLISSKNKLSPTINSKFGTSTKSTLFNKPH